MRRFGRTRTAWTLVIFALTLASAGRTLAQMPYSGWSLGSTVGSPAVSWQRIDTQKSVACDLDVAPAAPGGSGSLAASRVLGQGRWTLWSGLSSASYSRLVSSDGQAGVTFTPAPGRFGLLQATAGAGFEAGNSVAWESGLWPVSTGSASDFMAGLRWAPAAILSVHMAAHGGSLSEQEIGVNTAFSPTLFFALGLAAEEHEGPGSLESLAIHWQPEAQSELALGVETDFARQFWSTPMPGEGLGAGGSLIGLSRGSGQTATAMVDAPLSTDLALHLAVSVPVGPVARYTSVATPAWTASVTRSY